MIQGEATDGKMILIREKNVDDVSGKEKSVILCNEPLLLPLRNENSKKIV